MVLKKIDNQGTSLVELLIAMTVFLIVMAGFLSLFTSAFKYQQKSLVLAEFLNNTSYATEYMSRALRMATKDYTGDCVGTAKNNFNVNGNQITFLNYQGKCQQFLLKTNQVMVKRSDDNTSADFEEGNPQSLKPQSLTPASLQVDDLSFFVTGDGQADNLQPKVTFLITINLDKIELDPLILQTSISQRQLDVQY